MVSDAFEYSSVSLYGYSDRPEGRFDVADECVYEATLEVACRM